MAASIRSPAVTLLAVVASLAWVVCTASQGRLVGGKTEVANVRSNEEVQELGRFSVEEYNRRLRMRGEEEEEELRFVEVVEAQQQVVSGIKYYMKIRAVDQSDGGPRMFESVVVVKPWQRSKQLLHFAPSSPTKQLRS